MDFNVNLFDSRAMRHLTRLLRTVLRQGETIMATQDELIVQINAVNDKMVKIGTETTMLLDKVAELTAILEAGPVSDELQAAVDAVTAQAQVVDDLVPDAPPPPPPPPEPEPEPTPPV